VPGRLFATELNDQVGFTTNRLLRSDVARLRESTFEGLGL
jgi:hypothetical protein